MSKFQQRYGQVVCRRGGVHLLLPEFVESFPELALAMAGAEASEGRAAVAPHNLVLFWESDRMKFSLTNRDAASVCFGCVPDPIQALQSIERELQQERFEWKPRAARR